MKEKISEILKIRLSEKAEAPAPTAPAPAETQNAEGSNYDKIAAILNNDIVNTAAICEIVFGDKDATNRSLFRKKLNREPNDNGSAYHFDAEELLKISNALMSFSTQIRRSIGKQGKG